MAPGTLTLTAALALGALSGCDDLDRFTTEPGEAYCGSITLGAAFREGLSPRVQMRLVLDASLLDGSTSPGTIATYEAADEVSPERRWLDDAKLRPIPAMAHDPLSRLDIGEGRDRNLVYAVSPADPGAESLLAFVSLRSDETVEVRLVRGGAGGATDVPEGRSMIFGLFTLVRHKTQCGF